MGVSKGGVLWGTVNHFKNAGLFGHMTLCKTCQQKLVKTLPSIRLKSHYAVLGVKQNATKKEIKDAFIELTKKEHPDQNKSSKSSHERYLKILDAYDVLGKDEKRRNYDSELRATQGFRSTRTTQPGYNPGPPPGREAHYNRQFYEASQYRQYGSPYEAYEANSRRYGFSESARSRNMYDDDSTEFNPFANKSERRQSDKQLLTSMAVGTVLLVISTFYVVLRLYLYNLIVEEQARPDGQPLTKMAVVTVLLLVTSTCYVMLYRLIVEEKVRAEAKRTVRHEGDIKGVKWFYYAFKGFVAILVGFIVYDILYITHWLGTNKYRQWTSSKLRNQNEKQKLDQGKSHMKATQLKSEHVKASPIKSEHVKASPIKSEHDKASPITSEHVKDSPLKSEHVKDSPLKSEHVKASPLKSEHVKASPLKSEHDKAPPLKSEHDKASPLKSEHNKASPSTPEHDKASPSTPDDVKAPPSELEYVKASSLKSDHDRASTLKSV